MVLVLTTLHPRRPRVDLYHLTRLDCTDLAYRLRKADPAVDGTDPESGHYDCNLTLRSCECKGWLRWGHCRHFDSLVQLRKDGAL
jgi:hypothetical protein